VTELSHYQWRIHRGTGGRVPPVFQAGTVVQKSPPPLFFDTQMSEPLQHLTSNGCDRWKWKTSDRWCSTAITLAPRMHQTCHLSSKVYKIWR